MKKALVLKRVGVELPIMENQPTEERADDTAPIPQWSDIGNQLFVIQDFSQAERLALERSEGELLEVTRQLTQLNIRKAELTARIENLKKAIKPVYNVFTCEEIYDPSQDPEPLEVNEFTPTIKARKGAKIVYLSESDFQRCRAGWLDEQ